MSHHPRGASRLRLGDDASRVVRQPVRRKWATNRSGRPVAALLEPIVTAERLSVWLRWFEFVEPPPSTTHVWLVEPDYAALEHVADMLEAGTLRVIVGDTRPLAQVAELHAIGERGGPMGKLVATIG